VTGQLVGGSALALALLAFIRFFLQRQIEDLRDDVDNLMRKLSVLEHEYDRERGLKHRALNDVARTVMALDLVRRLAQECTCNVLAPVVEIVDRLTVELETVGVHRRYDDPPATEGAT
jgi:hypothetical protein